MEEKEEEGKASSFSSFFFGSSHERGTRDNRAVYASRSSAEKKREGVVILLLLLLLRFERMKSGRLFPAAPKKKKNGRTSDSLFPSLSLSPPSRGELANVWRSRGARRCDQKPRGRRLVQVQFLGRRGEWPERAGRRRGEAGRGGRARPSASVIRGSSGDDANTMGAGFRGLPGSRRRQLAAGTFEMVSKDLRRANRFDKRREKGQTTPRNVAN